MVTNAVDVLKKKARNFLASRYISIYLALIGVILMLSSINLGLIGDDYQHKAALTGTFRIVENDASLFEMFSFLDGDTDKINYLKRYGGVPWWTYENLKISFFRPLTEITHWLDYNLWPNSPALMHCQNLFWFALLIFAAMLVYHRLIGLNWIAGFAGLLFVVDYSHGITVGWLANRNALLAAFFGLLTLYFHDRWRKDGLKISGCIAVVMLALGLLSAELAISVTAYLFAYMLFIDRGPWKHRVATLLPYVAVSLVWLIARQKLGFGTHGSGIYIDPSEEPILFLSAMLKRAPIFLYGQFGIFPAEIADILFQNIFHAIWIWITLIAFISIFIPVIRKNPTARFFLLGMIISVIPICATHPSNRLLLIVGFGAMGLMAQFIGVFFNKETPLPKNKLYRLFAGMSVAYIINFHIFISAAWLPGVAPKFARGMHDVLTAPAMSLPIDTASAIDIAPYPEYRKYAQRGSQTFVPKNVVLINPPIAFFTVLFRPLRYTEGLPMPFPFHVLASEIDLEITRIDTKTLQINAKHGFFANHLDRIFRGDGYPMQVGQTMEMIGMTAEVLALTDRGDPQTVKFQFDVPLDDSEIMMLTWQNGKFEPYIPPAVGKVDYLKAAGLM